MPSLAILIPVLNRPQNVAPLLASLEDSVLMEDGWDVDSLFICSAGDTAQIAAIRAASACLSMITVPGGRSEYSRKINAGARATDPDWWLTAADDLRFHPGWLREAIKVHIATGALVIGTNDMANPSVRYGRHATHSLVHRDYLALGTIDEPGKLLHEGYDHNGCDVEFTETAQARGTWAFAKDSLVEHLHPTFDRSITRDATYMKGLKTATRDRALCQMRRHLWDPVAGARQPSAGVGGRRVQATARWPRR